MKQIAILSGKGGTGKTTITSSLIALSKNSVFVDADVDASDLHLVLSPQIIEKHEFIGGQTAVIDETKCISCNKCYEVCRYDAVLVKDGKYSINNFLCEGCRFCQRVCPVSAITMKREIAGHWYISKTRFGMMVHAHLFVGQENSGKLVTMVRHQARLLAEKNANDFIIIDGPPGIGCPVISTLSGVDKVIFVTEPSISAISDLKRVMELVNHFKINDFGVVINRYDINPSLTKELEIYINEQDTNILAKIPFTKEIILAQNNKQTIVEFNPNSNVSNILKSLAFTVFDA